MTWRRGDWLGGARFPVSGRSRLSVPRRACQGRRAWTETVAAWTGHRGPAAGSEWFGTAPATVPATARTDVAQAVESTPRSSSIERFERCTGDAPMTRRVPCDHPELLGQEGLPGKLHSDLLWQKRWRPTWVPPPRSETKEKVRALTSLPRRDLSVHRPEVGVNGFYSLDGTVVNTLSAGSGSVTRDRRAAGRASRRHRAR